MRQEVLMQTMSCVEFKKWQAFYMLEPYGEEWKQNALLRAAVMNSFGGKQGGGHFDWSELMPVRPLAEPAPESHVEAVLRGLPKSKNGKADDVPKD